MTAATMPLFLAVCEACGHNVRWVHDRPEYHHCQHNQETKEACPWKG